MTTRTVFYECPGCLYIEQPPEPKSTRQVKQSSFLERIRQSLSFGESSDAAGFQFAVVSPRMEAEYSLLMIAGGLILIMLHAGWWDIFDNVPADRLVLLRLLYAPVVLSSVILPAAMLIPVRWAKQAGLFLAAVMIPVCILSYRAISAPALLGAPATHETQGIDILACSLRICYIWGLVLFSWLTSYLYRELAAGRRG